MASMEPVQALAIREGDSSLETDRKALEGDNQR